MIFLNHGLLNMKVYKCIDFFGNYFSLVTQVESSLFFLVLLLMAINSTQQLRYELLQKRDNRLFTFFRFELHVLESGEEEVHSEVLLSDQATAGLCQRSRRRRSPRLSAI